MGAPSKVRRLPVIARGASTNLALLGLLAAAFITGWLAFAFATAPARWSPVVPASTGLLVDWGSLTAMDFHVGAALTAVPLAIWHVAVRRVRVRPTDLSRRRMLRGGAALATAAAAYAASEMVVRITGLPGATRRFTGSYESGSFRPDLMPVSSWMFDAIPSIDRQAWTLQAGGREWTYDELFAFDDRVTATLACTGGFLSPHDWRPDPPC